MFTIKPLRLAAALALTIMPAGQVTAQELSSEPAEHYASWKKLPFLRETPPTPRTFELARQLQALERQGRSDEETAKLGGALVGGMLNSPPGLVEAFLQATGESPDVIAAMRERTAEVYARNYTDDELAAMIGYLRHPVGRAIHEKQLARIGGASAPRTAEEEAWLRAFEATATGQALKRKKPQVTMMGAIAGMEFSDRLGKRAAVIFCAKNTCSDEAKRRMSGAP